MPKKIDHQKMEKQLKIERKSCWESWMEKDVKLAFDFAEGYKQFLNTAKTERESVKAGLAMAKKAGFKDLDSPMKLKPGDKVYFSQKDRAILFAKIGKQGLSDGFKLIMSHIDSPHLDLKVNPLYEDEGLAFFKTHYYGGIKKYQWPTIALAIHGVAYLLDGKKIKISIGESENDPVFMITDLLPHLDRAGGPGTPIKQREVQGEELNLLVGSVPVDNEKIKEKVKLAVLEYLYGHYGIKEEDLSSAELQIVPSEKARDLGFDRSMVSAYGHDDRSCAYASLKAFLDAKDAKQTQVCAWVDREEIGSEGETGAQSICFELFISKLLQKLTGTGSLEQVYQTFGKSQGISADVVSALDPDYKEVHDLKNVARLGYGVVIEKYTGSGGKYFTSEIPGEYLSSLRRVFQENNVSYQLSGGLGKIDLGGGGTIAKYMANRNIKIADIGIPLFNMHAPLEIMSKADLYSAYLGYKAFF